MTKPQVGGVKKGTWLGGIRTVEDVNSRCYEDDLTGCWNWRLALSGNGHPHAYISTPDGSKSMSGVAAALHVSGRPVPKGLTGYHTCGNKQCMNPAHMKIGTHKEKWAMLKATGMLKADATRRAKNTQISRQRSKLTPFVDEIRTSSEHPKVLALKYGCTPSAIYNIRAYKSHKQVFAGASIFTWKAAA